MKSNLASIVFATLFLFVPLSVDAQSPHLKMGNPSNATADESKKNNFLMEKDEFALSYNNENGGPNWVSWRLTRADVGNAPRFAFHTDVTLPDGFNQILPRDYTGSGFDRGHQCPHSDRSANDDHSTATFVMTNMLPQSAHVNQKAWAQLELYCRDLVEHHQKTLYIICGGAGVGGTNKNGQKMTAIGTEHSVTVPAECWKVIMVLDNGPGDEIARVTSTTRLIAVIMPNDPSVGEEWSGFRVSVKDVENETGFTFFDKVPKTTIDPLKELVDAEDIPEPTPIHH